MKKITSLLMAGMTVMAMNGCDENDIIGDVEDVESVEEVDIQDLYMGYAVTGTYVDGPTVTYEFCNKDITSSEENALGTFWLEGEDVGFSFDGGNNWQYLVAVPSGTTDADVLINGNTHDTYASPSDFTISSITEIECTLDPR